MDIFFIHNLLDDTFLQVRGIDYSKGLPDRFDEVKDENGEFVKQNNQIVYCLVEVGKNLPFNPNTQKRVLTETRSSDQHESYHFALKLIREWVIEDLPVGDILDNLKKAYVEHKDNEYPEYLRERHKDQRDDLLFAMITGIIDHLGLALSDVLSTENQALAADHLTTGAWQKIVSSEYDQQKKDLEENGIIPSFVFTPKT